MSEKKENLFTDFPAVSTQQWMEKITADLKGADFDKKLVWKTNEGFNVRPFYRQEDIQGLQTPDAVPGVFPYVRGTKCNNDWYVRQDIAVTDAKSANAKALDILNKGITSLGFKLNAEEVDANFISTLLNGISADAVELNFKTCVRKAAELAELLVAYFSSKNYDLAKLEGSINCDPIKQMLKKGKNLDKSFIVEKLKAAIEESKALTNYRVVGVNAKTLSNSGAYISQELGYALSWGNEYLSSLAEAGIDVALAAKKIKFTFGIGGNYFMEIAKFRAARMLWAKIVEAYKPAYEDACKMRIQATTSEYNKTIFDAYVNMLRTQTEAMSASLAGVDSLTVKGYDITYQTPDEFSERIARNQQLLLKEESHFDKVTDPSAGSYYIETLTASIAEQAWKLFLEIEEQGGFLAAVKAGTIQNAVNATHKARFEAVAKRREILLGTNQFPNFTEKAGNKIVKTEKTCGCESSATPEIPVLERSREAAEFEALRLATEKATKQPKVFMLTIGNLAMRLARAQFSSNFFACAGYEIIDNLGFKTVEEGVEAAQKAAADIIVLCSSDDEYAELAPAAFKAINGKQLFVVAGAPACTDDLKAVGIENFINVRSNVLETLKGFNAKLLK
jgi:methylmalonyl-CoA mutase